MNFLRNRGVTVSHCVFFKQKRPGSRRNEKINVALRDAQTIESPSFWPYGTCISCRLWLSNRQWEAKIAQDQPEDDGSSENDDHDELDNYNAKFKPYLRPEWTPEVKHLHDRERQMRNIWLIEGRPRGMVHDSYKNYKKAKREFRNKLNAEHDRYMTSVFHDIDQASECDVWLFWKLVKRQRPRNTRSKSMADLLTTRMKLQTV
uniref:Uncharacterized protein n=1 Tax=Magallana gigas TaxID=29159 RepID=A0A8W8JMS3_MAGGI